MNWDHPNNFKFVLTWLEAQRLRIDNFYRYYTPLGQNFEYRFNNWWQQVWVQRYAPNGVLETWSNFSEEPYIGWPPSFHPGPCWQETGNSLPKILALPDFGLFNPDDIRKDVERKFGWQDLQQWPSFESIWAAIDSQVYASTATPFMPYWGVHPFIGYREDFVLFLMRRAKLLWQTNLSLPHTGKCFLGAGRVSLDPTFDASSRDYRTIIYFVLNEGTHHCKLFEVKPGCCKRFKKR